ncbi:hypothetical protein PENSPDRAFT_403367 [Peniophora sp. CONT]|nr:hypothetical protein PENSPDRAFT_403367 [Peniophora sp. CONT]
MVRRGALEIETSASTPVPSRSAATRARQSPTTRRRVLGHGLIDRFKGHRRHASAASSQASVVSSSPPTSVDDRRVLAPLHFNLRRLPSRRGLSEREKMRAGSSSGSSTATAGTKRKRAASGSENATRGRSRSRGSKRRRGSSGEAIESDAESESVMDVDDGDEVASADEEDSSEPYLNTDHTMVEFLNLNHSTRVLVIPSYRSPSNSPTQRRPHRTLQCCWN